MISNTTLQAVQVGILTDAQLNEAIKHYSQLEKDLAPHGECYFLVWKDVTMTLHILKQYKALRMEDLKKNT